MIIALLTDFGTQDYFVGAMKGVILSINQNALIVDISHEIPPQDILSASFNLRACYKNFPKKTIFTTVIDPGVGSERKAVLVETEDHYFIAPDNGLLSFIFHGSEDFRVYEINNTDLFLNPVSSTFHGRDIFAPAAAHLSNGVKPAQFGKIAEEFVIFNENRPRRISDKIIEGEIIHTDRFGNLITNLKREDLPKQFVIKINGHQISNFKRFFAESEDKELFIILGSAGFLEIAACNSSASKQLKVEAAQKFFLEIIQ